jgi:hypothetical protein
VAELAAVDRRGSQGQGRRHRFLDVRAFQNQYWPAHYFIDSTGRIRHHHFGEGEYDESEQVIQRLLAEAGRTTVPAGLVAVNASGAEAASEGDVQSPETGQGVVTGQRLYQLIRQRGAIGDHTFEITFLDAGVQAYAFTFG